VAPDKTRTPTFDDELDFSDRFGRPLFEAWEDIAQESLRGKPPSSLQRRTHEGIDIDPLYTAEDVPLDLEEIAGMRRGRTEIASPIDLRDPKGTIGRIVEARDSGADSLWLWVDRRSVSWGRLTTGAFALFQEAADGAPMYLDGRGAAPALAALLAASSRRLDGGFESLRGGFDIDPLGVLASDGTLPTSLVGTLDLMAESLQWCEDNAPRMRTFAVSTLPHVKAGATAVQELAIMLATGVAYLRAMDQRGLAPELVFRRLRFITAVGRDLFMETAKLRALRTVWTRVAGACGVSLEATKAPVHAISSPRCLTVRDPWVNILRGTTAAYSAVIGGADAVTVLPFDSVAGRSDELARRLAINTSTILREESSVDRVRDPAAGSYYVEKLTADLSEAAWTEFQRVEAIGGMIGYLRSGALARELADSLASKKRHVTTLEDRITGISSYPNLEEPILDRQRARRDPRRSPDDEATDVHRAVGADTGSFAEALEAAHGGIVAWELAAILRGSDEKERMSAVATEREAVPFESLRYHSDGQLRSTGVRPRVFLAVFGSSTENRAKKNFISNLLAAGGVISVLGEDLDDPAALASAFEASGSRIAIICASSNRAAEVVPLAAREFRALRARRVLVAGGPGRLEDAWRKAGVNGFIRRGDDAVALLTDIHEAEGVARG
jgi:methylmalonyl-CoA mutase